MDIEHAVGDVEDSPASGEVIPSHAARLLGVDVEHIGDPLTDLIDSEFAMTPTTHFDAGAATNDLVFVKEDGRWHARFVDKT